jgi:hypothetical protein
MPLVYCMDSIVKSVGGDYLEYFQQNVVDIFTVIWRVYFSDQKTRQRLKKLVFTWKGVFSDSIISSLERIITSPSSASTSASSGSSVPVPAPVSVAPVAVYPAISAPSRPPPPGYYQVPTPMPPAMMQPIMMYPPQQQQQQQQQFILYSNQMHVNQLIAQINATILQLQKYLFDNAHDSIAQTHLAALRQVRFLSPAAFQNKKHIFMSSVVNHNHNVLLKQLFVDK